MGEGCSAFGEYESQSYTFLKAGDTFPKNYGTTKISPSHLSILSLIFFTLKGN